MKRDAPSSPGALGRLGHLLAIGFGSGYAPVAPGTAGSVVGLLAGGLLAAVGGWPALLIGTIVVAAAGIRAADEAARRFGRDDPREVVVDEIAGQMLTLLFFEPTLPVLVAGFFLFRFFDILKPFPARRSEALPGGLGIMVDDLIAGVYANLALHALNLYLPGLLGAR